MTVFAFNNEILVVVVFFCFLLNDLHPLEVPQSVSCRVGSDSILSLIHYNSDS